MTTVTEEKVVIPLRPSEKPVELQCINGRIYLPGDVIVETPQTKQPSASKQKKIEQTKARRAAQKNKKANKAQSRAAKRPALK